MPLLFRHPLHFSPVGPWDSGGLAHITGRFSPHSQEQRVWIRRFFFHLQSFWEMFEMTGTVPYSLQLLAGVQLTWTLRVAGLVRSHRSLCPRCQEGGYGESTATPVRFLLAGTPTPLYHQRHMVA